MNKDVFNPKDTISAKMGKVFIILDGRRYHWMNVKNIEVKGAVETAEIKSLGSYLTRHRQTGVALEGTMTAHWVDSTVQDMVLDLVNNNEQTFFDVQGVSEDPSSNSGKNAYLFTNCVLDGDVPFFSADSDGEFLEEEITFKPNGIQKLSGFTNNTSIIAG